MIYFDNATTSYPKFPLLEKVCLDYIRAPFSPNRSTYKEAFDVERKIFSTRDKILKFFNAPKDYQVIFSPGVTFSLNTFIKGFLTEKDHILISGMEHNAVMRPLHRAKIDYSILPSNEQGRVIIEKAKALLNKNTKAVILNHASNLTGLIQDIEKIGKFAKENSLLFVLDSAQSAGHIPIDIQKSNIDFLAFSSHKALLSLAGSGGFVARKVLLSNISQLIDGGTASLSDSFNMPEFFPDKFEAGTGNTLGILALSSSLDYINSLGLDSIMAKEKELFNYFILRLKDLKNYELQGYDGGDYTAIIGLRHKFIDLAEIADSLAEKYSILTRLGICCTPLACKTLGILDKGGLLRFSLSFSNSKSEIDDCIRALEEIEGCSQNRPKSL